MCSHHCILKYNKEEKIKSELIQPAFINPQDLSKLLIWSQKNMSREIGRLGERSTWSKCWGVREDDGGEHLNWVLKDEEEFLEGERPGKLSLKSGHGCG